MHEPLRCYSTDPNLFGELNKDNTHISNCLCPQRDQCVTLHDHVEIKKAALLYSFL